MLHLAEIMYVEDIAENIKHYTTINRLVHYSIMEDAEEKVTKWFNDTFDTSRFKIEQITIHETIN